MEKTSIVEKSISVLDTLELCKDIFEKCDTLSKWSAARSMRQSVEGIRVTICRRMNVTGRQLQALMRMNRSLTTALRESNVCELCK